MTDYSKTVNLLESPFPMRGNLAKRAVSYTTLRAHAPAP